ncbi:J domain-containing protein [Caenorhabditis elegans]|uniref:J domain-containing protein n=1 Tax=Caenorhabditis elegans TaxID=6239 RepID=G5ECC5_CAEEL|nr:J domain-containing protein [Caenorhabditis elegans]CAB60495.2 J domain-containing protein [Caenorhabditis elegans]|eukprot:NP_502327.2 Uncharacterized protein CELE_Y39C12A.9 [Caenorhabditis elegans]
MSSFENQNHYQVLKVRKNATHFEIYNAYMNSMAKVDPNDPYVFKKDLAFGLAYSTLSDPGLREEYDRQLDGISRNSRISHSNRSLDNMRQTYYHPNTGSPYDYTGCDLDKLQLALDHQLRQRYGEPSNAPQRITDTPSEGDDDDNGRLLKRAAMFLIRWTVTVFFFKRMGRTAVSILKFFWRFFEDTVVPPAKEAISNIFDSSFTRTNQFLSSPSIFLRNARIFDYDLVTL